MKQYPKLIVAIAVLASTSRALLAADVAATYSASPGKPPNYSTSNSSGLSASSGMMAGLNAQAILLTELIQEHEKKVVDLTQKSLTEKAKWEMELLSELQEKSARVQKSIEQVSPSRTATNDAKAPAGDVDHQLLFLSAVDSRLDRASQFPVSKLAQLLLVFEQPLAGAHDLAHVVETPRVELLLHELFKVISERYAGRHECLRITGINRYS